jgi:hypothetical protein
MELHGILPVPSVFVIDSDGVIAFTHTNADYEIRLSPDEIRTAANLVLSSR